ncbi:hypothetical protein [Larkinella soli]|uniref:hypothetical protein n=1 Tax=Larkinella soli TaxID=1770527 RepID=UPI000FFCA241|nr:hypothetical protein [Larkinella soli]
MKFCYKTSTAFFAFLFSALLIGCNNKPSAIEPTSKVVTFRGQLVKIPDGFPAEALYYTTEDYERFFFSLNESARISSKTGLTLGELNQIITPIRNQFPNTAFLDEKAKKRIKIDFNSLSDSKMKELAEVIDEFYDKLASFEIIISLAKKNIKPGARKAYFGYETNRKETLLLANNPRNISGTDKATT